jgi:cell division protein FtsB
MSLFKERQASAKKVIQLQNEILSLKKQLESYSTKQNCTDCDNLKLQVESILLQEKEYVDLIADLKASNKKLKSENTKLKNKLSKESEDV